MSQSTIGTVDSTGATWTIQAQSASTGANSVGGDLVLCSGTGLLRSGKTRLRAGNVDALSVENGGNVALFTSTGNYRGGTKVLFVAHASVVPTTNPGAGGLLYSQAGAASGAGPRAP